MHSQYLFITLSKDVMAGLDSFQDASTDSIHKNQKIRKQNKIETR